jgi:hypothetical protein
MVEMMAWWRGAYPHALSVWRGVNNREEIVIMLATALVLLLVLWSSRVRTNW